MADRYEFKDEQQRRLEALKKDNRSCIVRGNGYNPEKDQYDPWEHQPYPTWVNIKNEEGKIIRSVIANNKEEEDKLLGRKPEPAKIATVDTNQIAAGTVAAIVAQPKKRGRPAKTPLPANLD